MLRDIPFLGSLIFILFFTSTGLADQVLSENIPGDNCLNCQEDNYELNPAEWTLIYYLAADNDQEYFADNTLSKLLSGTEQFSNHPQIIIFLDRFTTEGIEVFEISNGKKIPLATMAELNSADEIVLQNYATNALEFAKHDNIGFETPEN